MWWEAILSFRRLRISKMMGFTCQGAYPNAYSILSWSPSSLVFFVHVSKKKKKMRKILGKYFGNSTEANMQHVNRIQWIFQHDSVLSRSADINQSHPNFRMSIRWLSVRELFWKVTLILNKWFEIAQSHPPMSCVRWFYWPFEGHNSW